MSGWFAPPEMRWDFFWNILNKKGRIYFATSIYLCVKYRLWWYLSSASCLLRSPSKRLSQCCFGSHHHCCFYRASNQESTGSFSFFFYGFNFELGFTVAATQNNIFFWFGSFVWFREWYSYVAVLPLLYNHKSSAIILHCGFHNLHCSDGVEHPHKFCVCWLI